MDGKIKTSIIFPTTAEKKRAESLLRAIKTVTTEQRRPAIPIIVLNGSVYDPELRQTLRSRRDIRFFHLEEASFPKARHTGRQMVDTAYFGFLDDDDEYLPGAIELREASLAENRQVDAVVSNGYHMISGKRLPIIRDFDSVTADPAVSLLKSNWLPSCGGLYRSSTVGTEFFDPNFEHLEWTHTALKLITTRRISFINVPTFINHQTLESLSRSASYAERLPDALAKLIEMDLPKRLRRLLTTKLSASHHELTDMYLDRGAVKAAWHSHLRSINHPAGFFRYGLCTRRFLYDSVLVKLAAKSVKSDTSKAA